MIKALFQKINSFHREDRGAVLILVSLLLLPMLLIFGLAVDSSYGLDEQKKLQMACDAAAKAGAANGNGVAATISSEAQKAFTVNTTGMSHITGPTISINTSANTVTVSASIVVSNYFMTLGGIPTSTYSASATCSLNSAANQGCVYSLNPSSSGTINLSGASQMNIKGCGIYVNSSSSSAVQLSGSANITASFLKIVGNYTLSGAPTITTTQSPVTGASPAPNPIGVLSIPSYSSCTYNNFTTSSTQTINPGVYCNGIGVYNNGNLTLNPGQYIIDGGYLTVASAAKLTGNNVTVILTKKLTTSYAGISFSNASTTILSAPTGNTSNPFNGIAIYQDPNAPSGVTNNIEGSANLSISGIVYLPNQILDFSGGSSENATCMILIAQNLILPQGITINCPSSVIGNYMYAR